MTLVAALCISGVVYAWGLRRMRLLRRAFPLRAAMCFALGSGVAAATACGPLDRNADVSLAWHMLQHLALVGCAVPLLLLGAPLRLALGALPTPQAATLARALASPTVRFCTQPFVAWLQFAAVLYGTHFSPLYEAALEHPAVHVAEHVLYAGSALVFWTPLLAVAPAPHAPPHPVRLLALFAALPMSAFLGFALYVTQRVLYAHYAGVPGALDDQMRAGALMWLAGGLPLFVTLLWTVGDWGARERSYGLLADRGDL